MYENESLIDGVLFLLFVSSGQTILTQKKSGTPKQSLSL
jgi:hypothetical protein